MTESDRYTVAGARAAAADGSLEDWVTRFLDSPGSDNAGLAMKLAEAPRWWIGPVMLPLDRLARLAGPAGHPVAQVVEEHEWRDDVADLAAKVDDGHVPAPVIVMQTDDDYLLEDGNHRVEAVRQAGGDHIWAIVGFTREADRDAFIARTDPTERTGHSG